MARGVRAARRRQGRGGISLLPWQQLSSSCPHAEVLDAESLEAVHQASLDLLEGPGMRVLHAGARRRLAEAGAEVDDATLNVRFDRGMVQELIALAPAEFTLHARNPARNLRLGGRQMVFSSVGGPAWCSDLERGRRRGSFEEVCDFLRLVQTLPIIHQEGGGPFEPIELPAETRHLDLHLAQIRLLDKNWQPVALGQARSRDAIHMACISLGMSAGEMLRKPALFAIINTNSPLQLDLPMAEGLMEMAAAGQAVCITPFALAGVMAPVTLAGALVQQNAEVLAGITLAQAVRPGAPVVYGAFASNADLRSGAPAFGTPEFARMAQAAGQLARRYGLPLRLSSVTSANIVDAQSTYESALSLWAALSAGANIIAHAAGWLESGLTASFEKLIVDAEMLQMMASSLQSIEVNASTLALDAIAEAGAGGHFLGLRHTLERFETAFYEPLLSERRDFEAWQEAGAEDAGRRANRIWKMLLESYQQPPLDPAIDEELADYVARRKRGEIVQ